MSTNKVDVNLTSKSDAELLDKVRARQELKAKMVTVLSRGVVHDRLHVETPDDVYGEWVSNDKSEIYRMQTLGFEIDKKYARQRALHDEGAGDTAIVGDVIFMTCPREVKEVIDEIRLEQYQSANSARGGRQKEERDFDSDTANVGLPSQIKSRVDSATVDNIKAALTAKD